MLSMEISLNLTQNTTLKTTLGEVWNY